VNRADVRMIGRGAVECPAAGEHLVEHAAERPDVGAFVHGLAARCSGVMYAAVPRISPAAVIAGEVIVGELRTSFPPDPPDPPDLPAEPIAFAKPKSSTLTVPSSRTLMFAGLEITMDDAGFMRRFQRFGNLPRDRQRFVDRDRPARDPLGEIFTIHQSITSANTAGVCSKP
jgi:hypothetical protein